MRRVVVMGLAALGSFALSCTLLVDLDGLQGTTPDAAVDARSDATPDARGDADADAATVDAAPDAPPPPCDRTKPFDKPVAVSGLDGSGREDLARFSPDLLTAYVLLRTPINGITVELLQYERATLGDAFTSVLNLGIPQSALGTVMGLGHFGVSENELDLVYVDAVDKSATECTRGLRTLPFGNCAKLSDPMASPFLAADAGVLFGVGAGGGKPVGPAVATRGATVWNPPVRMTELDIFGSPTTFSHPVASVDQRTLFFATVSPAPSPHVMVTTRAKSGDPFGAPVVVPELEVNGTFTAPTWLSADQCTIFLVSDRIGTTDIFTAKRPK